MAVYVWKCNKCQEATEVTRSISNSDLPPVACKNCEETKTLTDWQKVIQPTGFVLNGGGWFKDNYEKGGDK